MEILVIRETDDFTRVLIENGFSVVNLPTVKTETLADLSELENFLARIETFDGMFITSAKAAEIVAAKLNETGKTFKGKFYVLGKRSDDLIKNCGYETFFSRSATTAEELLKTIPKENLTNKKFLFPRGNRSLRVVPETLRNYAEVFETVVYRTVEIETSQDELFTIKEKLARGNVAAVCFFSPTGVESFLNKFKDFSQKRVKIAAIGRTTANFISKMNLRVDFISAKPTARDFADELTSYLRKEI